MNRWRVCDKCGEHYLAKKPCPVCNKILTVEDLTAELLRRVYKVINKCKEDNPQSDTALGVNIGLERAENFIRKEFISTMPEDKDK